MFKNLCRDLWKVCKGLRLRSADAEWRPAERGAVLQRTCIQAGRNLSKFRREHSSEQRITGGWLNVLFPGQWGPQTNTPPCLSINKLFSDRNTLQLLLIILWTLQSLNIFYTTQGCCLWLELEFSHAFPPKRTAFVAVVKQKYSTVILSFLSSAYHVWPVDGGMWTLKWCKHWGQAFRGLQSELLVSAQRSRVKAGHLIWPLNLHHH